MPQFPSTEKRCISTQV